MIDFKLACSLRHGRNEQFPILGTKKTSPFVASADAKKG
jgi:hypothetical protein